MDISIIEHVDPSLRVVNRRLHNAEMRTRFYDVLLFLSAMSKSTRRATEEDIDAFYDVVDYARSKGIPLWQYLSAAHKMMDTWKCEYLPVKYYLNDKVKTYVSDNYLNITHSLLYSDSVHTMVGLDDKLVRSQVRDGKDYQTTLFEMAKRNELSKLFLVWKAYVVPDKYTALFTTDEELEYMRNMHNILRPLFNYSLSKAGVLRLHPGFRWSHSKFEQFDNCPILFRDQYIYETVPFMSNEANVAGTKAHSLLEEFMRRYTKSKTKKVDTLYKNMLKTKEYADVDEVHLKGFETFAKTHVPELTKDATEILTEETFKLSHNGMDITGIVDLIIIKGNSAHVLDYKTSKIDGDKLKKNNVKYAIQLSLYAEMLRKMHPEITGPITASIYYTRNGGVMVDVDIDTTMLDKRAEDATRIKDALWTSKLEPKTSHCFVCSHPTCAHRKTQSMWNADGSRRIPEKK